MKQKDSIQSDFKKVAFTNKQKFLYNGILIIIPFIILLILEAGLTILNYGNDLSLFKESELYPGYYEINQDVNLRYFCPCIRFIKQQNLPCNA